MVLSSIQVSVTTFVLTRSPALVLLASSDFVNSTMTIGEIPTWCVAGSEVFTESVCSGALWAAIVRLASPTKNTAIRQFFIGRSSYLTIFLLYSGCSNRHTAIVWEALSMV